MVNEASKWKIKISKDPIVIPEPEYEIIITNSAPINVNHSSGVTPKLIGLTPVDDKCEKHHFLFYFLSFIAGMAFSTLLRR